MTPALTRHLSNIDTAVTTLHQQLRALYRLSPAIQPVVCTMEKTVHWTTTTSIFFSDTKLPKLHDVRGMSAHAHLQATKLMASITHTTTLLDTHLKALARALSKTLACTSTSTKPIIRIKIDAVNAFVGIKHQPKKERFIKPDTFPYTSGLLHQVVQAMVDLPALDTGPRWVITDSYGRQFILQAPTVHNAVVWWSCSEEARALLGHVSLGQVSQFVDEDAYVHTFSSMPVAPLPAFAPLVIDRDERDLIDDVPF